MEKNFNQQNSKRAKFLKDLTEQFAEFHLLNMYEESEITARQSSSIGNENDNDFVHFTTTNRTKFIMCTVEIDNATVFEMIDDNIANLLTKAEEFVDEYFPLRNKYVKIANNIINEKDVSEADYTRLRVASLTQDVQRHELLQKQEE